jgi:hypothetical protein
VTTRPSSGRFAIEASENWEVALAKNTGEGRRLGQIVNRYQQHNETTGGFDKYDGDGNFLKSKSTPGKFKSIEERKPQKPPRG